MRKNIEKIFVFNVLIGTHPNPSLKKRRACDGLCPFIFNLSEDQSLALFLISLSLLKREIRES